MLVSAPAGAAVTRAVERRCAEATGVPAHRDEAALAMKFTAELPLRPEDARAASAPPLPMMPSLHVDTNNNGRYRVATVIMYLNDVAEGMGGETRYPSCACERDAYPYKKNNC